MTLRMLSIGLCALLAAAPLSAARLPPGTPPPPGPPSTLYCMRVEPVTGSLLERIECWTREEWADADVDLDREWAENGVRVQQCPVAIRDGRCATAQL